MSARGLTFPLVSRRRLVGLAFGAMHGARRGTGSDIAASRPYRSGDNPDRIDWGASARLSSARNTDEFVVREYFSDEAPRAIAAVDSRPAWRCACRESPGSGRTRPPRSRRARRGQRRRGARLRRPTRVRRPRRTWSAGGLRQGRGGQERSSIMRFPIRRHSTAGRAIAGRSNSSPTTDARCRRRASCSSSRTSSPPPALETWERALDRGWDVVPVVVQDPIWELSFPDVDRIGIPMVDEAGRRRVVRLRRGESGAWRACHEERYAELLGGMRSFGIEPVLVSTVERAGVFDGFLSWSAEREAVLEPGLVKRAAVIAAAVVAALVVGLGLGQLWLAGDRDGGDG